MKRSWTRKLNTTTRAKVKTTRGGDRYKVTIVGGPFDGQSKEISASVALSVSPNARVNPRSVAKEVLRRFVAAE